MKTITIQIGNSDDKLPQARWAQFVEAVRRAIDTTAEQIHFSGTSAGDKPWQNAAWVFTIEPGFIADLLEKLTELREEFSQTAIAATEGETIFI